MMKTALKAKAASIRYLSLYLLLHTFFVLYPHACAQLHFDITDTGQPDTKGLLIKPFKTITLEPRYGGQWIVAGDINNDGKVEIVSAKNYNKSDVHYTSAVAAQTLDGKTLWTWGDPDIGRKIWHHDVACQIHDWDNDGKNEVVLCAKGKVVELDGTSGKVKSQFKIPEDATDCLVFCDLTGQSYKGQCLVKNRYRTIYAYDRDGKLLWQITNPGGYRTAHQARPMDVDNDGRDEIMAGYAMLNHDGSIRWVYKSKTVDQSRGHLDCVRILKKGDRPEDFRLALTCCGANNIAVIDGNGKTIWEKTGFHFESINIGNVFHRQTGPQILVDIDHQPLGKSPLWVLDENGNKLAQIMADYCRHHSLLDWTGDGLAEIIIAHNGAMYDNTGKRIATFLVQDDSGKPAQTKGERSILEGDFDGDGITDIMLATPEKVYIYKNKKGKKSADKIRLGTEPNFTLY